MMNKIKKAILLFIYINLIFCTTRDKEQEQEQEQEQETIHTLNDTSLLDQSELTITYQEKRILEVNNNKYLLVVFNKSAKSQFVKYSVCSKNECSEADTFQEFFLLKSLPKGEYKIKMAACIIDTSSPNKNEPKCKESEEITYTQEEENKSENTNKSVSEYIKVIESINDISLETYLNTLDYNREFPKCQKKVQKPWH